MDSFVVGQPAVMPAVYKGKMPQTGLTWGGKEEKGKYLAASTLIGK